MLCSSDVIQETVVQLVYYVYDSTMNQIGSDSVFVRVLPQTQGAVNLTIDSNNNGVISTLPTDNDEQYEHDPYALGKFIPVYNPNLENAQTQYIPMRVCVKEDYDTTKTNICFDYQTPEVDDCIELYYQSGSNYYKISPGVYTSFSGLFGSEVHEGYVYIKGVAAGRDTSTFKAFNEGIRDTRKIKVSMEYTLDDETRLNSFDSVQYIVADANSFVHELIFNTSLRSALAAQAVYDSADLMKYGLQKLDSRIIYDWFDKTSQIKAKNTIDAIQNLSEIKLFTYEYMIRSAIYQDYSYEALPQSSIVHENIIPTKYMFAFQGTVSNSIGHWISNVYQAFLGNEMTYNQAKIIGENLRFANTEIRFVGHSLGGGLASCATAASQLTKQAITFNAAGLHSNYYPESNPYPSQLPAIFAYYVSKDILTESQRKLHNIIPVAAGISIGPLKSEYNSNTQYLEKFNEAQQNDRLLATVFRDVFDRKNNQWSVSGVNEGVQCHLMRQIIFGLLEVKAVSFGYTIDEQYELRG